MTTIEVPIGDISIAPLGVKENHKLLRGYNVTI